MNHSSNQNPSSDNYSTIDKYSNNQISILTSNNSSFDSKAHINENQNQNNKRENYTLLSSNTNIDNITNKSNNNKKKKRKKNYKTRKNIKKQKNYFKNIYKKQSIIGICLNLFLWIWILLLILDYNRIIRFPRWSSEKMSIIYIGTNNDSFWGGVFSTILCTIFNYFISFLYPEIISLLSYCVYIIYSLFTISNIRFRETKCLLSYNMYIFLVFLTLGEIYKCYARKYLDI